MNSAYHFFEQVKDKRKARGKQYSLAGVLTVCVPGKLSGENTPADIAAWARERGTWLCPALGCKQRLKRTGQVKMPCAGSYSRILNTALDVEDFERVMQAFVASQSQPDDATQTMQVEVSLDGKKMRGTITADTPAGVYLLAVYQPGAGVVLLQVRIPPGNGEVTTAPRLLKALDLQGKLVTDDAEFAQRNLSIQIVAASGGYVWKVKGNQSALLADIAQQKDHCGLRLPHPTGARLCHSQQLRSGVVRSIRRWSFRRCPEDALALVMRT